MAINEHLRNMADFVEREETEIVTRYRIKRQFPFVESYKVEVIYEIKIVTVQGEDWGYAPKLYRKRVRALKSEKEL